MESSISSNDKIFIPLCFKKDLHKFSEVLKFKYNNDKTLTTQITTNLPARDTYHILKNIEMTTKTCNEIEYSKQRMAIKSSTKLFKISKHSDIHLILTSSTYFTYLKLFNFTSTFKLIRFFSYSQINDSYFFLFQAVNTKNDKYKYCKGGVIIPCKEKKVFIYVKRSKKNMTSKNHKYYFDIIVNEIKIVLEVMERSSSKEEIERLSSVESERETEVGSEEKYNNYENYDNISENNSENSNISGDNNFESFRSFGSVNLDMIETESHNKFQEMLKLEKHKFVIDINDEDYIRASIVKPDHLQSRHEYNSLNLFNAYKIIHDDMAQTIAELNIPDNDIIRFICGWKGDLQSIKPALVELMHWREEFKPQLIKYEEFLEIHPNPKELIEVICQDIYGRPCLIIRTRNLKPKIWDAEIFVRYLIYNVEYAISIMPFNIDKVSIVLDIKDARLENFAVSHLTKIKEQTSKYYVERLSNIFVINRGFFFGVIWKFISRFLDERVKAKMLVIDKSHEARMRKIFGNEYEKVMS